jgi:hypothetical protein
MIKWGRFKRNGSRTAGRLACSIEQVRKDPFTGALSVHSLDAAYCNS